MKFHVIIASIELESRLKIIGRKKKLKNNEIPYRFVSVKPYDGIEDPNGLIGFDCSIIFGNYGTGKTWLAYSLVKELKDANDIEDFELLTEVALISSIKAGFKDNTADKILEHYQTIDLLVVDEMGKSNDTEFTKSQLFEILNYRYNWMKRTVLICNAVDKSELSQILNPGIYDRYRGNIVEMTGATRRHKK
jgi:DNA replication protein DnaC